MVPFLLRVELEKGIRKNKKCLFLSIPYVVSSSFVIMIRASMGKPCKETE
jgi:hypothetical protein